MKIWKEFGSSHSSNITIVGTFQDKDRAEGAFDMIRDFVLGSWEERYPSLEEFNKQWQGTFPNVAYAGIFKEEYETGIDQQPDMQVENNIMTISHFRTDNIGGIIKLLRLTGAEEITIR